MKISKRIALFICTLSVLCTPLYAQTDMKTLGDSLFAYTGFSRLWSPNVRVKQMRINGNNVTIHTNATLHDYRWTPDNIADIKRKVSRWTLGHENGKVTIYSSNVDIETLITSCAKTKNFKSEISNSTSSDLADRQIVLYPSHGLYFNKDREEWIWQRATLWTTVEDLYSQEYVRLIREMLVNAGATVLSPRAGLDQQQLGASGMPQWTEGARYWLQSQKADSSIWNLYDGNEYKDDMKCRAMWVNSQECLPDLCLAFHTDGLDSENDSTIIGSLAIYTAKDDDGYTVLRDGRDREKTNRNLADWILTSVTEDLRQIAPEWTRRQLKEANYCESRVPVVPSIILELLSHKNMADMRYGLNPAFRFAAARAVYKGILRYFNGPQAVVQPLPVQELAIGTDGVLRWLPTTDSLESTAVPTYYMVYVQADNGEWNVQQVEKATQLQMDITPGVQYNYYVVAGNEGGLSLPSPVISSYLSNSPKDGLTARPSSGSYSETVLIIDAFNDVYGPEWFADSTYAGIIPGSYACEDRFSCAYIGQQWNYTRKDMWVNDDNCGWGACYRDHAGQLTIGNTRDYAVQHGQVLKSLQRSYVSCTAGMLPQQSPISNYQLIDFICGRQRRPIDGATYGALAAYLDAGGRLLLSTDHYDAIDANWAKRYLHATYYAAKATRSGKVTTHRSPFTIRLMMEPNDVQLFTPAPQSIMPTQEAKRLASYEDMRCPAAVGYEHKTLVFGFPLEATQNFDANYRTALKWLLEE